MKLTTEIEGVTETLAMFRGVELGMADLRQLGTWKAVQSVFYKILKEQFGSEGSSGKAGKWVALKPAYAAVKQRRYGNVPILTASGKLYRSLTSEGADGSVVEMSAQELTIGTTIPYAGYHQKGTSRMPKREIFSLTDEQEKQMISPIQDKLKQLVANAKLRSLRGF